QLDPPPGEDAERDTARRRMQNAERIGRDSERARDVRGAQGAEQAVAEAMGWLDGVAGDAAGMLETVRGALNRAMIELTDAQDGVRDSLDALDYDPSELEATEERLFAIRAMARKHGVVPDDLAGFADILRSRLSSLEAGDADLASLRGAYERADIAFQEAAADLSAARHKAATALDKAVMMELAPLKMERAVFKTCLEKGDAGPDGIDKVAFQVATNPGAPAGALNKIASGGELSRFLLALKVCLSGPSSGVTMIFDEIDRGVGGATADAVGRRLARLAENGQVLVVTHSPQVAARGAHHWRVQKQIAHGMTLSDVVPLPPSDRIDEIARMISGDTVTDEARAAARALLTG
ncbi:MAG: DNA repair protein RecN, partial [Arenibacterium sp.]